MAPRSSNTAGSVASGTNPFPTNGGPGGNSPTSSTPPSSSASSGTKPYNNGLTPSLMNDGQIAGGDQGSVLFGGMDWPIGGDDDTPPTTTSGSRGGGGRAATPPVDYSKWLGMVNGYKPQQYTYDPYQYEDFAYEDYKGTGFYDWDPSAYDTARQGVRTGVQQARDAAGNALDRSQAAYDNMGNPYRTANVVRQGPLDSRIQQSMADYGDDGAGGELTSQNAGLNRGMGQMLQLLAGSSDDYRQNMSASVNGDRAAMIDRMGMAEATMTLGINVAMQKAKSQYEKDKWQYGEQIAQQNYQKNLAIAQANSQGRNSANLTNNQGMNNAAQANTLAANTFNESTMNSILDILASGGKIDPSAFNAKQAPTRWTDTDQAYKEGKESGAIDQATIDRLLGIPDWQKRQDAKRAALAAVGK